MQSDSSYLYSCEKGIRTLLSASHGDWSAIPRQYLDYFYHEFSDGDISLVPAVDTFENTDFMEIWQLEEVAELLSKVDPKSWPDIADIVSIDAPAILEFDELPVPKDLGNWEFVEDNLSTSDIVQRALKGSIESVFGKGISQIRSKTGQYPSAKNNFLLEKDGTFAGTFKYENFSFEFEIAPTEKGWICTYRLDEKSLDTLEKPEFKGKREHKVNRRKVRSRGWR